ncbi:hypothetical protein B7P43_G08574 [Cryptotermes secundus]|uniref:DUF4817 domain-containing protein n=1 Tax=Cryptotermes secundus TaxID=105785 RepID=A0A2J7R500_9NEOP|nr:hypothetical protein B7P43_G08574 [Cryptotermes secundus]
MVFWRVHALYLSAETPYLSLSLSAVIHTSRKLMCYVQSTLQLRHEWLVISCAKLLKCLLFSHVEYYDMHFVYRFCGGNARAAVEEYQRRFPD